MLGGAADGGHKTRGHLRASEQRLAMTPQSVANCADREWPTEADLRHGVMAEWLVPIRNGED
jgi:hypothetical protein